VPLIGEQNAIPLARELAVSLAGRYERYSDFGSTTNPKVGLRWSPVNDLVLYGTWGTSFRAPSLNELGRGTQVNPALTLIDPNAPGGPRQVTVRYSLGGNPNLREEHAETFSLTGEWRPRFLPRSRLKMGYFNIDYTDRVYDSLTIDSIFRFESSLPLATVRDAAGNLLEIRAFAQNVSAVKISGFDFSADVTAYDTGAERLTVGADATIFDRYIEVIIPGGPSRKVSGRVDGPSDWRARAYVTWNSGPFTAFAAANHVGGLTDERLDTRILDRNIGSQTTIDLQLAYRFPEVESALRGGWELRLGANNLLGRRSPFVDTPFNSGIDGRNFVVNGRTIYVRAAKRF
jgi:iron complex outermembrane receptor protein